MTNTTAFVKDSLGHYHATRQVTSEDIVKTASEILFKEISGRRALHSPGETARFLQLELAHEKNEHFGVLYLDNQHQVIGYERLFSGTVDASAIYPRVVAQHCLTKNAAAVIFAHNHPSGVLRPSQSDKTITKQLKSALALIDVRSLDHIIVSGTGWFSFAEHNLI